MEGPLEKLLTVNLDMPDHRCYVTSASTGLLEMQVECGEQVKKKQMLAVKHDINLTGLDTQAYSSSLNSMLIGRHVPGLINIGDVAAAVAVMNQVSCFK